MELHVVNGVPVPILLQWPQYSQQQAKYIAYSTVHNMQWIAFSDYLYFRVIPSRPESEKHTAIVTAFSFL